MKPKRRLALFASAMGLILLAHAAASRQGASTTPVYLDSGQPAERRVEDLLKRMTLKEKVGQLGMPTVNARNFGKTNPERLESCRRFAEGSFHEDVGPGGGFFVLANSSLPEGPRRQAEFFNELQRIATTKTRLKIPLLIGEEGTHGVMASGATIFPEGPTLGSAWNMGLIREVYAAAAREARAIGIHQLWTLVVEPARDPRLGRNIEAYSECPFFSARVAEAIVQGVQGTGIGAPDRVVAGLCHFPGQSQPEGGLERSPMHITERTIRDVFLPPWVAGVKRAGALGVMATYPAIDGVPMHSSSRYLTEVLREELGFQGVVFSEGNGVRTLVYERIAADLREAGAMAIRAGVDISISWDDDFVVSTYHNVREGKVSMEILDRAVRRVLRQKFALGLFERPFVDEERAVQVVHQPEHRELALRAAREGIVLLKNENGLLPLRKDLKSIAVIGPNADDGRNQLGDYTTRVVPQEVVTVLAGIKARVSPQTRVVHVKGCNVIGERLNEIDAARRAAQDAELAVVVVGEQHAASPGARVDRDLRPTTGEAFDVASLDLTGMQEELIRAVHGTGIPTVVVLINGRPLSTRWTSEHVPAIMEAWQPGEQGGNAVADVLFGDYNPSGRLPLTIPRHSGQLPFFYYHSPAREYWTGNAWGLAYVDMSHRPLYEFGFGLSYTSFEYRNLTVTPRKMDSAGDVTITAEVANTGKRHGEEVVQLYIRDVLSSVVVPVKELRGFSKVPLAPGEHRTVSFKLTPYDYSLLDRDLKRVVEPGRFEVMIGASSEDIRMRGDFQVRRLTPVKE